MLAGRLILMRGSETFDEPVVREAVFFPPYAPTGWLP